HRAAHPSQARDATRHAGGDADDRSEAGARQGAENQPVPQGGVHWFLAVGLDPSLTVFFQLRWSSPSFGGRYSFEGLTISRLDVKTRLLSKVPSTTTPIPSRNI